MVDLRSWWTQRKEGMNFKSRTRDVVWIVGLMMGQTNVTRSKALLLLLGIHTTVSWPLFVSVPRHSTSRRSFALEAQNLTTQ